MALGISLIILSLIGLIYGIKKKSKGFVIASVLALIVIAAIGIVYWYLYSRTHY